VQPPGRSSVGRQGRLVADLIAVKVDQALNILNFTQKSCWNHQEGWLVIANAEHNDGADIDDLKVKTIYVEQGATLCVFCARQRPR
jgi:large subunit ribosomal protein L22